MRPVVVALVCAGSMTASLVVTAAGQTSGTRSCSLGLSLSSGTLWSEKTGQHTATFVLTNRSQHTCVLDGYPHVQLLDERRRLLRFRYSHTGDQMITSRPPQRIVVRPGGRGFFALNKYRCDIKATAIARIVRVQLPGQTRWLRLWLPAYPLLDYCPEKPSLIITLSPLVESLGKASAGP
jgi:hypothetical protein